jgi:predicted hotdog family 3-hydroxylacyl-ACP dehydratase
MVEMIAQSVAALYHRRTKRPGEPQIDFLVGIKEARFSVPRLPMKAELTVAVEIVTTVGNYGLFKGEVMHGDKCFCETLVQVLEPGEDLWETLVKGRVEEVTAPE